MKGFAGHEDDNRQGDLVNTHITAEKTQRKIRMYQLLLVIRLDYLLGHLVIRTIYPTHHMTTAIATENR